MKAKVIAAILLTLVPISSALAGESCEQTASRVKRFLDANPEPTFAQIEPFIGPENELFYCLATPGPNNKSMALVLSRLVAVIDKAKIREPKTMDRARVTFGVTDSNFEVMLSEAKTPIVLVTEADWCQPCKRMRSTFTELDAQTAVRVVIATLNVDRYPKLVDQLKITDMPTVIAFEGGKEVKRHVGILDKTSLAAWIDAATTGTARAQSAQVETNTKTILAERDPLVDIVVGSTTAPVTVIAYGSVLDVGTKKFAQQYYPRLKADYIDTGKVRFLYREVITGSIDYAGAVVVRCMANNDDQKYLRLTAELDLNFEGQTKPIDVFYSAAARHGLDKKAVDACIAAKTRDNDMNAMNEFIAKVSKIVSSPPQFFVNGERIAETGNQAFSSIDARIRSIAGVTALGAPHTTSDCAGAETHWKTVEQMNKLEGYLDHLKRFPDCTFATIAKIKILELKNFPPPPANSSVFERRDENCERLQAMGFTCL